MSQLGDVPLSPGPDLEGRAYGSYGAGGLSPSTGTPAVLVIRDCSSSFNNPGLACHVTEPRTLINNGFFGFELASCVLGRGLQSLNAP